MSFSISLAALLTLSATAQAPEGGPKVAAIAPFVGDEVAAAIHIDLKRWEIPTMSRRVLGKMAEESDVAGASTILDRWVDGLRKAGATDVYFLIDMADMPGSPLTVVPLAAGADGAAIAARLEGGPDSPLKLGKAEVIRGAVVAGTPAALDRARVSGPARRPDVIPALASGGDAPITIAIIPSTVQRRSLEESMPDLPPPFGGAPITTLTRGLDWASISLTVEPNARLKVLAKAKDADAAKALQKVARNGLAFLAKAARATPSVAELAGAVAAMKPEAAGDQVTVEADLDKAAALVAVPVRQAREAAQRTQCVNNLKQIGLAMHNYHSTHNAFAPAYLASKDGKPLLSWRVAILPYIEQQGLYDQFHLDEAWDSPHNKALISKMPPTYACPTGRKALAAEGKTTYLTPRGPATIFPGAEGVKLQGITDGTSNTILAVDAGDDAAVIWTKPDDWEVAPEFKANVPWGHHPNGTNFLFADGSVRFLRQTMNAKVLQALLTRDGDEVISADDF